MDSQGKTWVWQCRAGSRHAQGSKILSVFSHNALFSLYGYYKVQILQGWIVVLLLCINNSGLLSMYFAIKLQLQLDKRAHIPVILGQVIEGYKYTCIYGHYFIFFYLLTLFHPISLSFSHFLILLYLTQYIRVAILSWNDKLDLIPETQFYVRTCSDLYTLRHVCIVLYNL